MDEWEKTIFSNSPRGQLGNCHRSTSRPRSTGWAPLFQQNNYMNMKKMAKNRMLLWLTLDSVPLYQYHS